MVVVTKDDHEGGFDWETSTAVPPALREALPHEPRVVDLRWAREEATSRSRTRASATPSPTSRLLCTDGPKDELHGEDVRQHRRSRRLRELPQRWS